MCSAKAKFVWHDKEQKAFEEIKAIISRETLLAYPDFSKDFHIYTDSSDYQLGAVIMQNDHPLAFYSRKLNSAQKRYTTGKQELLSIVETLKEFKNILLGQKLIVHTDHKNLLYQKMSTDRIIRWRLLIEEFGPTFLHIGCCGKPLELMLKLLPVLYTYYRTIENVSRQRYCVSYCCSYIYRYLRRRLVELEIYCTGLVGPYSSATVSSTAVPVFYAEPA
jgi:hypothetical protein